MIALALGIIGLLATLAMDTTVASGSLGGRVNNIGLINDKQNLLLVFAAMSIVGAIFVAFGGNRTPPEVASTPAPTVATASRNERTCPFCAEEIRIDAVVCRYCQRDIPAADHSSSNATHAARLLAADISSPEKCVAVLVALGCRVTRPSEDVWEVLHPSGVTAYARSPEALQALTSRHVSPPQIDPQERIARGA